MRILHWGLVLCAFGPLFAAWPGLASPYALPKLLVLALGVLVASLGALRSKPNVPRPSPGAGPNTLRPLAACLGALALASVFSYDWTTSLLGEYSQRSHGLLPLALCASLVALVQGAGSGFPRFALRTGAAAGAALSAYALLQLAGFDPVLNAFGSLSYGRAGSLVGSPIGLGCCLAMLWPLQLQLALDGEAPFQRRAGWGCVVLSALGLLVTWSRGAWLAGGVGLGLYLLWTGRLQKPTTRAATAGLTAAAVIAVLALVITLNRIRPTSMADMGRIAVWQSSWRMFTAHPLLGVGPDAFALLLGHSKTEGFVRAYGHSGGQVHAHNDVLEALAVSGLIGFSAYVWLLITAWRRLKNALRDETQRAIAAAAGAGLVAVFLVAKFNPIPLDGLALAALLLGLLNPASTHSRKLSAATLTLATIAVTTAGWLMVADRRCLEGMRAQHAGELAQARTNYAAATRINPTEIRYGFWLVGLIRAQARLETDPESRRRLGAEAVAAARVLEHWHPRDVRALHALGGSLAALTLQGGPDRMSESAAVLDRGVQADWSYRPVIETRLSVANLLREHRVAADCTARLTRLDRLGRNEP